MSEGVGAMMRLARSEAGLSPEQITPVDLHAILDSLGAIFEPMARERDIGFWIDSAGPAVVGGDSAWLCQLFGNVIDNAIRYNRPGGRVGVALEREGGLVAVRISDSGVGIPAAEIDRVFERFHRVSQGRDTRGWGVGLAIAREIARSHGGSIALESKLGVGSVFTVRLPLADG